MTKQILVKTIAEKIEGMTQKEVAAVLNVLPEVIKEAVESGDKVALTGFITFEKKDVEEKTGTVQLGENKGATWTTPAHSEVKAKLSKSYKML